MSINNAQATTSLIPTMSPYSMPILMLAPNITGANQHQSYFSPTRAFMEGQNGIQVQPQYLPRLLTGQQYQLQPHGTAPTHYQNIQPQQYHQPALPAAPLSPAEPIQAPPPPKTKEQTNAKVKNITDKCLRHYVDGQVIIETSKPLTKKKKKLSSAHRQDNLNNSNPINETTSNNNSINKSLLGAIDQFNTTTKSHSNNGTMISNGSAMTIPPIALTPKLSTVSQQSSQIRSSPRPNQVLPLGTSLPAIESKPILSSTPKTTAPTKTKTSAQSNKQQKTNNKTPTSQLKQIQKQHSRTSNVTTSTTDTTTNISSTTKTNLNSSTTNNYSNSQNGTNDYQKIRAQMPNWSVAEVVDFIERHEDIRQYSSKFAEDEVDGKALLLMIDRNLNFQILTSMFKHGPAMKIEATLSKYKLNE